MIAMVGGMFFAAPQIASADNGNNDETTPIAVVTVRDRNAQATITYSYLEDGRILVNVTLDDGKTFGFELNPSTKN